MTLILNEEVGRLEGCCDGTRVGEPEGWPVGLVGLTEGWLVGITEGRELGILVEGLLVG